jgi:ERF superfamily
MTDTKDRPGSLAEALAALQGQLPRVAKEHKAHVTSQRTGKSHSYDYADLTDVTEAIMPLMSPLGLSFTARPTVFGDRFVLQYALMHASGQEIGGEYPLIDGSPQEIGTAITYARRYALCAVTGLAPGGDDDDAATAEQAARKSRQVPDAQLAAEGRMTRAQAKEHDQLKADTLRQPKRAERSHPRKPDDGGMWGPDGGPDPWASDAPVGHDRAARLRESVQAEDRPGSSNKEQWQRIAILYGQVSITERETRLRDLTDFTGREITSAADLSYTEAEAVSRYLTDLAAKEITRA